MRFQLGSPPEDAEFDPEREGWVRMREPRPGVLMLAAIPLGALAACAVGWLWSLVLPSPDFGGPNGGFSLSITLPQLLIAVLALLLFVMLHESLHAVPGAVSGSSTCLVVGFWPRYLAPYVAFTGKMSRRTHLVSGSLPLLVLTALPFAVAAVLPGVGWWMAGLSTLNMLGSAADLIALALVLRQVPRAALVRNSGHATWWHVAV